MEKHILFTLCDDSRSSDGVEFLSSFFKNKKNIRVTLLSIASPPSNWNRARGYSIRISGLEEDQCQTALEMTRELLVEHGFLEDHIDSKLIRKRHATVEEIIRIAASGSYDAVMFGRHGFSYAGRIQSSLTIGKDISSLSTSEELLHHKVGFPVWVCRYPEVGRKNVLVCLDESVSSMRVTDHVGAILKQETEHEVTLFHVHDGDLSRIEFTMENAKRILKENGIEDERINELVLKSHRVIKSIQDMADTGAYAVVAVGHNRFRPKGLTEWFFGSICIRLLERNTGWVVWITQEDC